MAKINDPVAASRIDPGVVETEINQTPFILLDTLPLSTITILVTIGLPPLRDRTGDIKPLTSHYLERFSHELKIDNPGIREEALDL